jgi:hypothetical protein
LLANIAKKDSDWRVRKVAVGRLTDQTLLADIAKKDSDQYVREGAVKKLTDQTALADIAKTDADSVVAYAALERIKDSQVLDSLARHEGAASDVRLLAAWQLTDKPLLSALAQNAADKRVRRVASSKFSANTWTIERGKFADLISEGKLLAEINGDSIHNLNVTIRRLVYHPLKVTIPAGSYFVSNNPKVQNMVLTADVTFMLFGDSYKERDYKRNRDAMGAGPRRRRVIEVPESRPFRARWWGGVHPPVPHSLHSRSTGGYSRCAPPGHRRREEIGGDLAPKGRS